MTLQCIHCQAQLEPTVIFDSAVLISANFLTSICIECKHGLWFFMSDKTLQIGELDGFPGPNFHVKNQQEFDGLSVKWYESKLQIVFNHRVWLLPLYEPEPRKARINILPKKYSIKQWVKYNLQSVDYDFLVLIALIIVLWLFAI